MSYKKDCRLIVCFPFQSGTEERFLSVKDDRVVPIAEGSGSTPTEIKELIKANSGARTSLAKYIEEKYSAHTTDGTALDTLMGFLHVKDGQLALTNPKIWKALARVLDLEVMLVVLPGPAQLPELQVVATHAV